MRLKNTKYASTLQTDILLRFMGEKAVIELYEQYQAACIRLKTSQLPTEKQLRLANLARTFGTSEAARKAAVQPHVVTAALNKVAKFHWLKLVD